MSFASPTLELIRSRHSMRAFLPTPVPREIVAQVLQAAAQVVVLTGAAQAQLSAQICARFDQGIEESPDYVYTPDPWPHGFLDRARECGYGLFALKGIDRKDRVARRAHDRENFTFFGAPLTMIFHLSAPAERGMFLDMGLFLQNVMLGLWAHGIGSCPQFSLTSYSDTIRAQLGLEGRLIVCGLSAGYPDPDALVNTYVPPRLSLDAYVRWME
jgi:nitroreductase